MQIVRFKKNLDIYKNRNPFAEEDTGFTPRMLKREEVWSIPLKFPRWSLLAYLVSVEEKIGPVFFSRSLSFRIEIMTWRGRLHDF